MKRKSIIAMLLVLAMILTVVLVGCSTSKKDDTTTPADTSANTTTTETESTDNTASEPATGDDLLKGEGYKIGCILANVENSVYVEMKEDMEAESKLRGNEFQFVAAEEAADQISALESMVQAGCDAVIIHLINAEAEADAIKAAADQGVLIFAFDGESEYAVRNYTADNYNAGYSTGKLTGEWINENLAGKAKIGLMEFTKMEVLVERSQGMRDGLKDTCPDAEIVITSEDYTISMGVSGAENFLQAYPDLDGIMVFNGSAALGAYEAFKAANINDDQHFIFGVDGAPEEIAAIAEGGCYRGTTSMGFNVLGSMILDDALTALNGGTFESTTVLWPVDPVTIDNVADFQ